MILTRTGEHSLILSFPIVYPLFAEIILKGFFVFESSKGDYQTKGPSANIPSLWLRRKEEE